MYGCLASPWHTQNGIRDPHRPWRWEIIWHNDGIYNQRCVCRGIAKTRQECLTEIEALLIGLESPIATRIWCDSNTF